MSLQTLTVALLPYHSLFFISRQTADVRYGGTPALLGGDLAVPYACGCGARQARCSIFALRYFLLQDQRHYRPPPEEDGVYVQVRLFVCLGVWGAIIGLDGMMGCRCLWLHVQILRVMVAHRRCLVYCLPQKQRFTFCLHIHLRASRLCRRAVRLLRFSPHLYTLNFVQVQH